MKRRIFGTIFLVLGVLMVIASLLLIGYNLWVEEMSGFYARVAMDKLTAQLSSQSSEESDSYAPELPTMSNVEITPVDPEGEFEGQLAYREMPEVTIDGVAYIGYLNIPAIDLELPVIGESNEDNLEIAPCRFFGTVYQKNFVIGGHRYRKHFRKLSTLGYGETVTFTDMDGVVYTYTVADCEVIEPYEAEYLCSGNWDLSLYTCTPGGLTRVVLRCLRAD